MAVRFSTRETVEKQDRVFLSIALRPPPLEHQEIKHNRFYCFCSKLSFPEDTKRWARISEDSFMSIVATSAIRRKAMPETGTGLPCVERTSHSAPSMKPWRCLLTTAAGRIPSTRLI